MALRRFLSNRLALLSVAIILALILLSVSADLIAPFTYHCDDTALNVAPGTRDEQSGRVHWLGTDDSGCDILSRLLYGVRVSMLIGLGADTMIVVIGVSIGLVSGYFGGLVDNLLMRFTDVMYAFPSLVFAMVVIPILGRSILSILIALGVANWVNMARLVRGQTLQVRQMDYVLGARSIGAAPFWIIQRHVLPNILGPIIVLAAFIVPGVMTAEAALAFLGVGIDISTPTLGGMISRGLDRIIFYPHEVFFPVLALTILTLAFTFVGDGLRDALDPLIR